MLKRALQKDLRVLYLYADGHAVCWYEKKHKQAGMIEWMEVHEDLGVKCNWKEGRLIFKGETLPFMDKVASVYLTRGIECGSDNTREKGIFCEIISFYTKDHRYNGLTLHNFPGMISADIYWNENNNSFEDDCKYSYYSPMKVTKIHRKDGTVTTRNY